MDLLQITGGPFSGCPCQIFFGSLQKKRGSGQRAGMAEPKQYFLVWLRLCYWTFRLLQIPTDLSLLIQHEVCVPCRCSRLAGGKTFGWVTPCTPKRSASMPFPTTVLSRCTTATAWGGTSCGAIGRYFTVFLELEKWSWLFSVECCKKAAYFI